MFEASLPVVLTTTSEVGVGVSPLQWILRTREMLGPSLGRKGLISRTKNFGMFLLLVR